MMMERRCLVLICFIYSQVGFEGVSAFNITRLNATEGLSSKAKTNARTQSSKGDVKFNVTNLQTAVAAEMRNHGTTTFLKSSIVLLTVIPSLQKTQKSSMNLVNPIVNISSTKKQVVPSHSRLVSTFSSSTSSPYTASFKHHQNQRTSSTSILTQAAQVTSHLQHQVNLSSTEKLTDKLQWISNTPSHIHTSPSTANDTYFSSILRHTNITIPVVQVIEVSFTSSSKLPSTVLSTPSLYVNIIHSPIEAMNSSRAIKLKTSTLINLHPSENTSSIYAIKSHSLAKKVTSPVSSPQSSVSLLHSFMPAYTSASTSKFVQDISTTSLNTKFSSSANFVNKTSLQPTRYKTKIILAALSTITTSSLGASTKTLSLSSEISTEIFKLLSSSMVTPVKLKTRRDETVKSSIHPTKTITTDGNIDSEQKKQESKGLPAWIAILSSIAVFIAIMTIVVVTCKYIRWNKDHGDYTLWISNLELQPITSRNAEVLT